MSENLELYKGDQVSTIMHPYMQVLIMFSLLIFILHSSFFVQLRLLHLEDKFLIFISEFIILISYLLLSFIAILK